MEGRLWTSRRGGYAPFGLRAFVEGSATVTFQPKNRQGAYALVCQILTRFGYRQLGKTDQGVVLGVLISVTGFSRQQVERLVRQWRDTGTIRDRRGGNRGRPCARRYTAQDVRLLAEVDAVFGQMPGLATREILRRQHEIFGNPRFARLATLSKRHGTRAVSSIAGRYGRLARRLLQTRPMYGNPVGGYDRAAMSAVTEVERRLGNERNDVSAKKVG